MALATGLDKFFKDEQEFDETIVRADQGDDRAAVRLGWAFARPKVEKIIGIDRGAPPGLSGHPTIFNYVPYDRNKATHYLDAAARMGNVDAIPFEAAVALGLRSVNLQFSKHWAPVFDEYSRIPAAAMSDASTDIDISDIIAKRGSYILKGPAEVASVRPDVPEATGPAQYLLRSHDPLLDSSFPTFHTVGQGGTQGFQLSRKVVRPKLIAGLESCAKAGQSHAAKLLSDVYRQPTIKLSPAGWIASEKVIANPLHDAHRASHWQTIVRALKGELPDHQQKKILDEFFFSQDATPEGLYNIGVGIWDNSVLAKAAKSRGYDYLVHAANLGKAAAAHRLGMAYEAQFDRTGDDANLKDAYYRYCQAAELGHPNGTARARYLTARHPVVDATWYNVASYHAPAEDHVRRYPASAWQIDPPSADLSAVMASDRPLRERLEAAVEQIDGVVLAYDKITALAAAKIEEMRIRQKAMEQGIDRLSEDERDAMKTNFSVDRKIFLEERKKSQSGDRLRKEGLLLISGLIMADILSAGAVSTATGGAHYASAVDAVLRIGTHVAKRTAPRLVASGAAASNERNYRDIAIRELEAQRIDPAQFEQQVSELAALLKQLSETRVVQQLRADEAQSQRLLQGLLMQRLLHAGAENCDLLEHISKAQGAGSLDDMLAALADPVRMSVTRFAMGHADTRDIKIILAEADAYRANNSNLPAERALSRFSEQVLKRNIDSYFAKASQIDVIASQGLVDFERMQASPRSEDAVERTRRELDSASRLALTAMFAQEFGGGVSHVGNQDIQRVFAFYLHRHGDRTLHAAELLDGKVADISGPKAIEAKTPQEISDYNEMVKTSQKRNREDQPNIGSVFLRLCGYEYFLPQAVRVAGSDNRLAENPEAPVAYGMVNATVQDFVKKMIGGDVADFREQIGPRLGNIVAQSFIDYFQWLGHQHNDRFSEQRTRLRTAFRHDNYGPRFDAYQDMITEDATEHFAEFKRIYERNLNAQLGVSTQSDRSDIEAQLEAANAKGHLALKPRNLLMPGTPEATRLAYEEDHRFSNMTENWRRA